jgi:hypothetical protein
VIYYGFDFNEQNRITRRVGIMAAMGYKTDYPKLWPERTIYSMSEVGIQVPNTYRLFKHANCFGCLKASLLHWYVVYVWKIDIYIEAIEMEEALDFTIHTVIRNGIKRTITLLELSTIFDRMREDGIAATEHQNVLGFARMLRNYEVEECAVGMPCECTES